MAPNTNNQPQRLDHLPREMLFCIMGFCDPRSLVNVICTSKSLRVITVQILLMGSPREDIIVEGASIGNWYADSSTELEDVYPDYLLDKYLDLLMKEKEVEMDRINLNSFGKVNLGKVSKFISKFKIPELITSPNYYDWVKNEINSSLSSITRLSFNKGLSHEDGNYFHTLLKNPYTVLNGICVKNGNDVKNLCRNPIVCDNLREITVSVYNSISGYAFKEILKSCPELKVLNMFLFGVANDMSDFEFDEELMDIICKSKLETLRLDAFFSFNCAEVVIKVPELKRDSFFPYLKIYSNLIGDPVMDSLLIPDHPLRMIAVKSQNIAFKFPKTECLYILSKSMNSFPIVDASKILISGTSFDFSERVCENMASCRYLKELHLHKVSIEGSQYEWESVETMLEVLNIQQSGIHLKALNQLVKNSPKLKSINMKTVRVIGRASNFVDEDGNLQIDSQDIFESELQTIQMKDCNGLYPLAFENIIKGNIPHLTTVLLENTYSITKKQLGMLFEKARSLSLVKITGAEFSDDLISKFLSSFNPLSLEYGGLNFVFNGKSITSSFLLEQPYLDKLTNLTLPDCIIPNEDCIILLEKMNPKTLNKLHVNLGKTGPTIELLKKIQEYKNLEFIYLVGKPESTIENFEKFVLEEFVLSMPSLMLLYIENGGFVQEEIEKAKARIRLSGKSAPRFVLPQSTKDVVYSIEKQEDSKYNNFCSLQ